jgi:hypothetical protein
VTDGDRIGIELLLSEPEFVAWLEPEERLEDDEDDEG